MSSITAIILTKNEEENIGKCIASIESLVERIIVVDSGSTDETIKIANEKNVDVVYNRYQYYAQQFNWAIKNNNIDTDWILRIDADERFTPELNDEIREVISKSKKENINGITIEAWLYFLNKKMVYGLSNKRKMMLFRTNYGQIEDRKRDAHTVISEGNNYPLKNKFLHYDFKDLNRFIERYNMYSDFEVEDYFEYVNGKNIEIKNDKKIEAKRKNKFKLYYNFPKFIRAYLWFIYNYILKLGFLDGKESFIYHYLECYWYRNLVDAKIYEQEKKINNSK